MNSSANVFFEVIDKELEYAAKQIRQRIFSQYRDVPWTAEQRRVLLPLIERELDGLVQGILSRFDNIGGSLPDEVLGWNIVDEDKNDIRVGGADYANMWLDHLHEKGRLERLISG